MLTDKLYHIEFKDDAKAIVTLSTKEHPVFRAHFPNNPILPGFMHFDIVADAFNLKITSIKKAKFLKTALPAQTLIYKKNNTQFTVYCNDEKIASFTL